MSFCFDLRSFADQLATVFAISISTVPIFFTSSFFFISDFCVLMTSRRNRFDPCFITSFIGAMMCFLSLFCTSRFFCDRSLIPVMICHRNTLCLCFATCLTCISLNTFFCFCCFFGNNTIIPCMTEFIDHCSGFQFCITVGTVSISCVAIFGASCFLCVPYFLVLMSGSRNDFRFCRIADSTGISLFSIFGAGSFFGCLSLIPGMLS